MLLNTLLSKAAEHFHTIDQETPVDHALKKFVDYGVSALIVTGQGKPSGIFTERDVVTCHIRFRDTPLSEVPVREVMSSDLIVARPEDEINAAMAMMIQAGIRHLPIVREGVVVAVIGLEDLVKEHIGALTQEIHYLREYISDLQDAAHD